MPKIPGFGNIGSGESRRVSPARGASMAIGMPAIFGETNPAMISSTPRMAGNVKTASEKVSDAPTAVQYGWIGNREYQTDGMSVLYLDKVIPLNSDGIQTGVRDTIGRSAYAPMVHFRAAHWMYSRWDPIFRFANTAMDMRFGVGRPAPLTNAAPGNLPSGARMGPYAAPYRAAYRVPRFSTEPFTIIPKGGK